MLAWGSQLLPSLSSPSSVLSVETDHTLNRTYADVLRDDREGTDDNFSSPPPSPIAHVGAQPVEVIDLTEHEDIPDSPDAPDAPGRDVPLTRYDFTSRLGDVIGRDCQSNRDTAFSICCRISDLLRDMHSEKDEFQQEYRDCGRYIAPTMTMSGQCLMDFYKELVTVHDFPLPTSFDYIDLDESQQSLTF
jgi:hypothetical protein